MAGDARASGLSWAKVAGWGEWEIVMGDRKWEQKGVV